MNGTQAKGGIVGAAIVALLVAGLWAASLEAKPKGKKEGPEAVGKRFDIVTLVTGLRKPTTFDFLPDGTMLVAEKQGRIYSIAPDGGARRLILDISDHVANGRERGMGSVEPAYDFATSRRVYLSYTFETNHEKPGGPQAMRLTYITLNPDGSVANPLAPETVVLGKDATRPCPPVSNKSDCPPSRAATHQGGTVISAPDGTLFMGWGDNNLPNHPGPQVMRTQNPASTAGKILHVDDKGNGLPGHPFCRGNDDLGDTCTKIFARGFRNPYRFALTPSGDPVVADVGWNSREEIDLVRPGRNYGWPCFEGNVRTPFYEDKGFCRKLYGAARGARLAKPILSYRIPLGGAGAAAIMGPYYPGGGPYPEGFEDSFFVGDYALGFIKLLKLGRGGVKLRGVVQGVRPVQMQLTPQHELTFVDYRDGAIRQLVFAPANKAPKPQITAIPTSGHAPLTVSFSGLGSTDPDGDKLSYDWDFGDGSAHSDLPGPVHTYSANGLYTVRLRIADGRGATGTATTTITVGNTAPAASIVAPTPTTQFRDGDPVALLGGGVDAEDGALGNQAFHWEVDLIHKDHEHPAGEPTGAAAQFETLRDHDADSFYRVTLTVTDSQGLSTTAPPVEVRPETVPLKIRSRPGGVKLSYGGRSVVAPEKVEAAIGFRANLSAPREIRRGGARYRFARWSQGGNGAQIYVIPDERSKVKAIYKRVG